MPINKQRFTGNIENMKDKYLWSTTNFGERKTAADDKHD